MSRWNIKLHPDFFKDLDKLSVKDIEIFYKIKENPLRQKHLSGGENCYREPITKNIRLIYYIEGDVIWLLTIGKHKEAYREYLKRLYPIKGKRG